MPYMMPITELTQFLNSPASGYTSTTGYNTGYSSTSGGGYDDAADDAEEFFEEMDDDAIDRPQEQKLHEHYKMEKKDPTHRMGDMMTAAEVIYDDSRAGKRRDEYNAKEQSFAIWVVSPKDRFYAGSHKVGQFHHSSFLSGKKVLAAGEMVVSGGKRRLLTGKSGHCKPQLEHLAYAVEISGKQSIDLSSFRVQVWKPRHTNPVAPTAQEFIDDCRFNKISWEAWSGCGCAPHQKLKRADWDR